MSLRLIILTSLLLAVIGCASGSGNNSIIPSPTSSDLRQISNPDPSLTDGRWGCWGIYDLEIACDGSYVNVAPDRSASVRWGYHLNAVKFLEEHPCTDCFRTSNLHVLPNGDVSIDVTLEHPWPDTEENRYCTGFDVRGVVMFRASQYMPDNELRIRAGMEPWNGPWHHRYSSIEKGDPELVNLDGWTSIWAPDYIFKDFDLEEGLPIYEYYPGKYATGADLGTINGYKHFWTNETRHMFEAGKSATRTYIIHPPAQGSVIEASYAIYAHWAPPSVIPVNNPAEDFPPQANSSLPYELQVYQTRPLDPDATDSDYNGPFIRWHVKTWSIGYERWYGSVTDILFQCSIGQPMFPVPGGEPDEYWPVWEPDDIPGLNIDGYRALNEQEPDTFPGKWPYIMAVKVFDPEDRQNGHRLSAEYFIAQIEFEESDGEW